MKEPMSETPTPSRPAPSGKGPAKRGGLVLPPRGQALARLQDLEEEQDIEEEGKPVALSAEAPDKEPPSTSSSNAVNTASSNAVIHEGNTSAQTEREADQTPTPLPKATRVRLQSLRTDPLPVTTAPQPVTAAPIAAADYQAANYQAPARAVRESTTRITVDMPDSLHQKISVLSAQTRRSIKDLVIEALAATYFGTDAEAH